ncbi:MAG: NAD(P)-dependent oxidoreductase [Myxococcales bacterium]|nr:NAD(P)-dependent oxidoreductase [Myxococcales bacterium]
MAKVALLGLGAMGARMARRLLDADHELTVYNRSDASARALVEHGAARAPTPRQAAASAEIVISMLTDDDAARSVWLDPERGALAGLAEGALAIESSTVTPTWINELGRAVAARGATLLDAPVAGSRPQAEAGELIYLVGGAAADLARARPLLETMGSAIHHCGPRGTGSTAKLVVNALFACQVAALAEMLAMARNQGLAPETTLALLSELPITSPALRGIGALIAQGNHTPMYPIALVEKDLRYASAGGSTPVVDAARAAFGAARDSGLGDQNISAIAKAYA